MPIAVWKHQITHPETGVLMRPGDKILTVATQQGVPCVWIEHIDPDLFPGGDMPTRTIRAVPTGSGPEPGDRYVGTCHNVQGAGLVLHLYLAAEG